MADAEALRVRCDAVVGPIRLQMEERFPAPWTVVFGPSGSGKSSLLRLLAGLWRPRGSQVALDGRELTRVPAYRRRIGLIAQEAALFPDRRVRENVCFGAPRDASGAALAGKLMALFELEPLAELAVGRLSGGERQRVALARALAARPRLLLLDEVFTGMHRTQRDALLRTVQGIAMREGMPVLSVTHDVPEALLCADEVVRLQAGRVVERGLPREVLREEVVALRRQMDAV